MIKFIRKKHVHEDKGSGNIIIYYSVTDIFLGTLLMILVVFFIHDYLSHALNQFPENHNIYINQPFKNQPGVNLPIPKHTP